MLQRLARCLTRPRDQAKNTWWSVANPDGERCIIRATEWHIGRLRSISPIEVYVHHETTGSNVATQAKTLEDMSEKEFAVLIANGTARRLA